MITFQTTALFFLAWMIVSTLGFVANLDSTQPDNFTNLTDSAFSVEKVAFDDSPIDDNTGVGAIFELPKATAEWVSGFAHAATFQSPIWDGGYSNIVRVILATMGGAYLMVLIVKGLEIVASVIPG